MSKKGFFSKNIVIVLFISLFVVIFGITAAANVFMSFLLDTMTFNIEQRMKVAAQRLTDLVSIEELDTYRTPEDMQKPSYQALRQKLYEFCEATGLLYAYYSRPIDGKSYYIVDNDYDLKTQVGLDTKPFDLTHTPWIEKCVRQGTVEVSELGRYTPGWSGIYSAYAPIFDRDGKAAAYAGVDIYDADIVFAARMITALRAAQVFAMAAVFALILVFLIRFRALREISAAPEKNAIQRKFLLFSMVFFLILGAVGAAVFMFAARQFEESKVEQSLNLTIESLKLRMANSVDAELQLSVKMADTPIVKDFFLNPNDAETRELALRELDAYRRNFKSGSIFWVNDRDKIFYYDGVPSYVVNPDDPATYWYNMTLYETERYNFNINYNPELQTSNLWVNAPVFENGKPIGMVGTGIDLTSFLNSWNNLSGNGMDIYFFNSRTG